MSGGQERRLSTPWKPICSGPDVASSWLASVIGSRSRLTSSRRTGMLTCFLGRAEVVVLVDPRGVLDLVLAVGHLDAVAGEVGPVQRYERLLRAEQAGLHGDPMRVVGAVVQLDLTDRADLVAVGAVDSCAGQLMDVTVRDHHDPFEDMAAWPIGSGR
jgi:hypothetical protein